MQQNLFSIRSLCRWRFRSPAEGSAAKIAQVITHLGGSALASPPHPMEFDKMEKKGGQRKGKERSEGLGEGKQWLLRCEV